MMTNLAEHLGLCTHEDLQKWIADAGLMVLEKRDAAPKHAKSSDQSDPLYAAWVKEVTSLYRLKVAKVKIGGKKVDINMMICEYIKEVLSDQIDFRIAERSASE